MKKILLGVYSVARWPFIWLSSVPGFLCFWVAIIAMLNSDMPVLVDFAHDVMFQIGSALEIIFNNDETAKRWAMAVGILFFFAPAIPGKVLRYIERKTGLAKFYRPKIEVINGQLVFHD